MKFKVNSLRIEKTMTYNNRDGEYEDNKIYIINCTSNLNRKYEVRLWTIYGDCYSGWCSASWGYGTIKMVESFIGMTHKPIKELEFELDISIETLEMYLNDMDNDIFGIDYEGGDFYYPSGYASVNEDLFEKINRNKEKRPIWILSKFS